jgi:hypothetical protein
MCQCLLDKVVLVQGCDQIKYLQTSYVHALMMFSKSLRMITTDSNMSELRKIVFKEYKFNIIALVGVLV